jgi:hypothetical protein
MTEEFLTDTLTGRRRCARELEFHPSPPTSPPPPQTAHQLAPSRVADRLTIYLFVAHSAAPSYGSFLLVCPASRQSGGFTSAALFYATPALSSDLCSCSLPTPSCPSSRADPCPGLLRPSSQSNLPSPCLPTTLPIPLTLPRKTTMTRSSNPLPTTTSVSSATSTKQTRTVPFPSSSTEKIPRTLRRDGRRRNGGGCCSWRCLLRLRVLVSKRISPIGLRVSVRAHFLGRLLGCSDSQRYCKST